MESVTNTTASVAPVATAPDKAPQVVKEEAGIKVLVGEFEGEAKGLKFAYPQASSLQAAMEKYTEEVILNVFNQALKSKIATKVKTGKLPRNVTGQVYEQQIAALQAADTTGNSLIFTAEEALEYKPGEREPGIKAQFDDLLENLKNGTELTPEQIVAKLMGMAAKKRK